VIRQPLNGPPGSPERALSRLLRLALGLTASLLGIGCEERLRPPARLPREPSLPVAPAPGRDPGAGRRVVAAASISQAWHVGSWTPASVTLTEVQAGDAILVLGVHWGDLARGSPTAPQGDPAALTLIVDQGPGVVGRKKPPVFAQIYADLRPAAGRQVVVPAWLGGPAGDGTLYVLQVRGLTEARVVASGQAWRRGEGLRELSVALDGSAGAGDLVVAIGGYDNTAPVPRAGWSDPPPGWERAGVQEDAANNVPSEVRWRRATGGVERATWSWADPGANVAAAVIVALR